MNGELQRIWKQVIIAQSGYYPGIYLELMRKTMKNLSLDFQSWFRPSTSQICVKECYRYAQPLSVKSTVRVFHCKTVLSSGINESFHCYVLLNVDTRASLLTELRVSWVHADKIPYNATYGKIKDASGIVPTILKKSVEKDQKMKAGLIHKKCSSIKTEKEAFSLKKSIFQLQDYTT